MEILAQSPIPLIPLYCERTAEGLWAEPFNVASNVSFFIAAWSAWWLAKTERAGSFEIYLLIALCIAIGIGSALFHMFAQPWAHTLDNVPILLFQLWFLWLYAMRVARIPIHMAAIGIAVFLSITLYGRQYSHLLNGSIVYAPALIVLGALAIYHSGRCAREPGLMLLALAWFTAALGLRSIDLAICAALPTGTHFLWHVLNGFVLYLSIRALVLNLSPLGRVRA